MQTDVIINNNSGWQKLGIKIKNSIHPTTSYDQTNPFNFREVPGVLTLIFLSTTIFMPTCVTVFSQLPRNGLVFFYFFINALGFIVSMIFDWRYMLKSGAWIVYGIVLMSITSDFLVILLPIIGKDEQLMHFFSNFAAVIAAVVLISTNKDCKQRLIAVLKTKKISLIFTAVITVLVGYVLLILCSLIYSTKGTSNNDDKLNSGLESPELFRVILAIVVVLFFAPFQEELTYRFGIFRICNTRSIGYLASTYLFAFVHFGFSRDGQNIMMYLIPSSIFSLLFLGVRSNVTYTIATHMVGNLLYLLLKFYATLKK